MNERLDFVEDPVGRIDLTDLELEQDYGRGTPTATIGITIGVASLIWCSRNTVCGTCNIGGSGC